MDRWSAWHILHGHIQPPKGEDLTLEIEDWKHGLSTAADAIAAQHEQEVADLVAQGAEMAEALRETETLLMNYLVSEKFPRGSDCDEVLQMVRDALSAAPKVAWRGPAVVGRAQLLAWDHTVLRRDSTLRPLSKHVGTSPGVILGEEVGTDGELVDLIALECPPKGEQPTESEQGATDD